MNITTLEQTVINYMNATLDWEELDMYDGMTADEMPDMDSTIARGVFSSLVKKELIYDLCNDDDKCNFNLTSDGRALAV
jgi:hypothetical protein